MLHIVRTCKIHKFKHLKQLFKVQILLISNNVETFVEVISFLAVICRGNVTRCVQSRSVSLYEKARGHTVFVEIYHLRTVAFDKQIFLSQYIEARFHLVVVKTLSRITVKLDFKTVVNASDRFHRDCFEYVEIGNCLFVSVLDTLEPSTRFIVHLGVLFRLFVIADVEFVEVVFVVVCNVFE